MKECRNLYLTSIGFKWLETAIEREISLPSFCVPKKPKIYNRNKCEAKKLFQVR